MWLHRVKMEDYMHICKKSCFLMILNILASLWSHMTTFEIMVNVAFFKRLCTLLNIYGKKRSNFLGTVFKLPFLLYAVTHAYTCIL